jgi:primosomal protein N' (replication factor Y)
MKKEELSMIASVVVDCKIDTVNRTFDYLVPPCFTSSIAIGQRVYVPFGKQNLLGIVVELKDESGFNNLKEIYDILDLVPCLNEELIMLAKNMHEYYFSLYITCLLTMIPQALRVNYDKVFICDDVSLLPLDIQMLFTDNKFIYQTKYKTYLPILQKLVKENKIRLINMISDKANIKEANYIKVNDYYEANLNSNQEEIVNFVKEQGPVLRSVLSEKFSNARVKTLIDKNVLI